MLTISNAKAIIKDNAWYTVMLTPPIQEEPTHQKSLYEYCITKREIKQTYIRKALSTCVGSAFSF